jgi:hypothetical protein
LRFAVNVPAVDGVATSAAPLILTGNSPDTVFVTPASPGPIL